MPWILSKKTSLLVRIYFLLAFLFLVSPILKLTGIDAYQDPGVTDALLYFDISMTVILILSIFFKLRYVTITAECLHTAGMIYHEYLDIVFNQDLSCLEVLRVYSQIFLNILAALLFILFLIRNSHVINYYKGKASSERDPVTGEIDFQCREVMSRPYWILFLTVSFSLVIFSFYISVISSG